MSLHGRLTYTEPGDEPRRPAAARRRRPDRRDPGRDGDRGRGATVRLGDKIVLRPGTEGDVYDKILARAHGDGRAHLPRLRRRVYLGVTVDDDPGQDLLRETGRYLFFFADEVEPVTRERSAEHSADAGLASSGPELPAWRSRSSSPGSATPGSATTGSAAHVVKRLLEKGVPPGVQVQDFGSGGLDLAYEVMRGYHAMVLVDVSQQGGEPGTST